MPRRRVKPPKFKTENIRESGLYYADNLSRLYRHDPQLISNIVEELYVMMTFVDTTYSNSELEKRKNELLQKEGR